MARRGTWGAWGDEDDAADEYDLSRPTEWDTLDDAMAAASSSPALRDGAVVITWVRHGPGRSEERRYAWRGSDLGMDLPQGAEIIARREKGKWRTP
ncbi:MAG: hypothetical protein IT198_11405 [Acidimicrobiia bacterium]|nr:hypothetical protein [Acidimicrobiia bacterium]